jgi:hypothetical protein
LDQEYEKPTAFIKQVYPEIVNSKGEFKKYINAYEYLRKH